MIDKKTVTNYDYDEGKYTNYQNISILLNLLKKIHIKKVATYQDKYIQPVIRNVF